MNKWIMSLTYTPTIPWKMIYSLDHDILDFMFFYFIINE